MYKVRRFEIKDDYEVPESPEYFDTSIFGAFQTPALFSRTTTSFVQVTPQASNFYFAEYDCSFESNESLLIKLACWLAVQRNLGLRSYCGG